MSAGGSHRALIPILWLVMAITLGFAGCRVGLNDGDDDGSCAAMEGALPGSWVSACIFLEVRPNDDGEEDNIFFRERISFGGGDDFTHDYREFADIDCFSGAERLSVSAEGTYDIGDEVESADGLRVCAIDFDYDEVTEEVDEDDVFEEPDTPFSVFDILYLLPEPEDGEVPRSLFTGDLDGPFVENAESGRPDTIDFAVEYLRQ